MTKHHLFADHRTTVCSHVGTDFKVSILITQGFSLLSLASMTDVFSAVESSWGHGRVKVRLLSVDGGPVRAASGSVILPDEAISTKGNPKVALSGSDAFVVCAGPELSTTENRTTIDVVRKCRLAAIPVCVMGAAVRAVAQSGQMTHATDHWTRIPANKETMPHVKFNNAIFVEDGNIVSCSGELGAMDFALNWVTSRTSARVAAQIRNHLLVSSSRSPDRVQTCTVADTYKGAPKQLQGIIDVMLENLEEPLSMGAVARRVRLSVRQLERLFARYLSTSPVKFYRAKQLEQARILIEDTNMTVTEVAIACGFSSFSCFARKFRILYGMTPSTLRSAQQPLN